LCGSTKYLTLSVDHDLGVQIVADGMRQRTRWDATVRTSFCPLRQRRLSLALVPMVSLRALVINLCPIALHQHEHALGSLREMDPHKTPLGPFQDLVLTLSMVIGCVAAVMFRRSYGDVERLTSGGIGKQVVSARTTSPAFTFRGSRPQSARSVEVPGPGSYGAPESIGR
jgi:hypothetical protein